jgi:hypothetical protein
MNGKAISAVDSIGPASEATKNFMFRPFQWARWWRIGALGVATGEFASSGCNPSGISDGIKAASQQQQHPQQFAAAAFPNLGLSPGQIALMITVLVVGLVALVLVHLYVGSVLRFVLFDAVAAGRYRLREGWKRWHDRGIRYFGFQLLLIFISLMGYAVLVGIPLVLAAAAGILKSPREHVAAWAVGIAVLLPILLVFAIVMALINLAAKDFAVPMMALENMRVGAALSRIWAMVRTAKGQYAGYVGLKIVLAIVIGVVMAVIQIFILMILFIPIVVIAVAVGIATPQVFQNPLMLAFALTAAIVLVFVLLFLIGVISAPIVYFFEAYVLTFFAPRYPPLWNVLHPAPPAAPAPPVLETPPEQAPPFGEPPEPFLAG